MASVNASLIKRLIREKYGTQEKFVKAFGVTRQTLDRWFKNGNLSDEKLTKLANFLSVDHAELTVPSKINKTLMAAISEQIMEIERGSGVTLSQSDHMAWCVLLYNRHRDAAEMTEIDYDSIRLALSQKEKS